MPNIEEKSIEWLTQTEKEIKKNKLNNEIGGEGKQVYKPAYTNYINYPLLKPNSLYEDKDSLPVKSTSAVPIDVGIRYDDGKLPMHLLPPELLTEVAKVLDFGAKKYAPRNWEKGMDWSRIEASLLRHLIKWKEGEDIDPETGLSHIAHVACNAAFLIAYINRGVGTDDRPIKSSQS